MLSPLISRSKEFLRASVKIYHRKYTNENSRTRGFYVHRRKNGREVSFLLRCQTFKRMDLFQRLVYFRWLFISVLEHQKCVATIPLKWWISNIPSFVLSSLCHWLLFVFLQFYRISFEFSKSFRDVIRSTIFLLFFFFFDYP